MNDLQKRAIEVFGMETQLLHAVEELTELSFEIQNVCRAMREGKEFRVNELLYEYCDGVNALKTIHIFLNQYRVSSRMIASIQRSKDFKFLQYIEKAEEKQ